MTLAQLVAEAARQLEAAQLSYGHGTTNAWDEAAWLVLWQLGLPLDADLHGAEGEQRIDTAAQQACQALIARRIQERKPAAYLTRQAWLHGVPFYVDERAIVPRSLIAGPIVDGTLDIWLGAHTQRVLDLCTGNGSLAILAALAWPEVQVDALDISPDALAVAAINVEQHGLQQRIRLIESDGLQALQEQAQNTAKNPAKNPAQHTAKNPQDPPRYDLILCNPPYVNSASMAALPAEYRAEPALALAGGADGMDFIRTLLHALPPFMNEQAVLVLEIGHERAHFERAFAQLNPVWLETDAGSDQVLLLHKHDLQGANR